MGYLADHEPGLGGVVLLVVGVVNTGLWLSVGTWRAWLEPRQIRRNAAQALLFNREAE